MAYDAGTRTLVKGPPIPAVLQGFRQRAGCPTPSVQSRGVVTRSVADCPAGRRVHGITIAGAGHQWPGGTGTLFDDRPSTAITATTEIWRFFSSLG
ncbi:hypothetical protein QSJ19_13435 [Gordonia sp. ABSL11-1]|uniref:hypothetical protein n=1 Tax=Gordonia sp. ABSL11-1 TaxID=3053924 RepID=UPI00257342D8|nr:hypothetical protein [Gordonia sp. ABSL11-1]MDL9946575.1 hypothetical protein [Gordonia sp. ABSL11-1]